MQWNVTGEVHTANVDAEEELCARYVHVFWPFLSMYCAPQTCTVPGKVQHIRNEVERVHGHVSQV